MEQEGKKTSKLVLLTHHYPFGRGEEFLDAEVPLLLRAYDEVVILSCEKVDFRMRKIPRGVTVIKIRDDCRKLKRLKHFLLALTKRRFWIELRCGVQERGLDSAMGVFEKILLCEDLVAFLSEKEELWLETPRKDRHSVFCSYWLSPLSLYLTQLANCHEGVFVSRAHGSDCFFDAGYVPYREHILGGLDAVFAISEAGRRDIVEHYSAKVARLGGKVHVSRIGLPRIGKRIGDGTCQTGARDGDSFVVVSCSNVIPLKRLDLLVAAIGLIDDLSLKWIHFGDGAKMEEIKTAAAATLDGKQNIEYTFMGQVEHGEIISFYENTRVDVFVNCSDREGIPVSIMEAMSFGIPAIARDVGGVSELIDADTGILLPRVCDSRMLADAIEATAELDGETYVALQNAAINKISKDYLLESNLHQMLQEIRRIASQKACAASVGAAK